jgi:hypothetical protein
MRTERDKILQKRLIENIFEKFLIKKQMIRAREMMTRREKEEKVNRRAALILEINLKEFEKKKNLIIARFLDLANDKSQCYVINLCHSRSCNVILSHFILFRLIVSFFSSHFKHEVFKNRLS